MNIPLLKSHASFTALARTFAIATILFSIPLHAQENAVLAKVGSNEVKPADILPLLEGMTDEQKQMLAEDPASLNQLMRTLIVRQLLLKEATAQNFEKTPAFQKQFEQLKQAAIAESYLLSVSEPPASFPSAAEIQAAYDANKASLLVPKQFRLAQIYIAIPPGSDSTVADAAKVRLDSMEKVLRNPGSDFAELAKNESDEPQSAARGGEIGWVAESMLQPGIRNGIALLKSGEISQPILLEDGWHIIKLLDVRESYTPALEEIREPLARRLRAEQTRANSEAYLSRILQENPVAINEIELSKLINPPKTSKP